MASQTFTHRAQLASSIETAWDRLQMASTWGDIGGMSEVTDARHDDAGNLLGFAFAAVVAGKRYPGKATTTRSEAPHHMAMDIDTGELRGTIDVRLHTDPVIEVTLSAHSKGLFSAMMFPVIAGAIAGGLPDNVERFATQP